VTHPLLSPSRSRRPSLLLLPPPPRPPPPCSSLSYLESALGSPFSAASLAVRLTLGCLTPSSVPQRAFSHSPVPASRAPADDGSGNIRTTT
jgi:hypothetical protein